MKKIISKIGLSLLGILIGLSPLLIAMPVKADSTYYPMTFSAQLTSTLQNPTYATWVNCSVPSEVSLSANTTGFIKGYYQTYGWYNDNLILMAFNTTGLSWGDIGSASVIGTVTQYFSNYESWNSTTFGLYSFTPDDSPNLTATDYGVDLTSISAQKAFTAIPSSGIVSWDVTGTLTTLVPDENGYTWIAITSNSRASRSASQPSDDNHSLILSLESIYLVINEVTPTPTPTTTPTPTPSPTGTPPTVTTGTVHHEGPDSVTLYGNLDSLGTADNCTVGFLFGTGMPEEWYFDAYGSPKNSTGLFAVTLTGLTPGVTYYYAARAEGDGVDFGDDLSFYHYGYIPSAEDDPVVMTLEATEISGNSAKLNGNLTSLGNYTNVTVTFQTRHFGETEWHTWGTAPGDIKNSTGTYSGVGWGFEEGVTHEFRAMAFTGTILSTGEMATYGSIKHFVGGSFIEPTDFTVTLFPASNILSTSVSATANVVGNITNETTVAVLFGYKPYALGDEYLTYSTEQTRLGNGTITQILSSLTPETKYQFIAYGIVNGTVRSSNWLYFTTLTSEGETPTPTGTPGPTITPTPTLTPTIPSVIDTLADLLGADLSTAGGQWFVILALLVIIPLFLIIALHNTPSIAAILSIACDAIVLGWAIINWLDPWMIGLLAIIAGGIIWAVIKSFFSGRGGS